MFVMTDASKDNGAGSDSLKEKRDSLQDVRMPVLPDLQGLNQRETTREILMRIQEPRTPWKWVILGIFVFFVILSVSIFLATRYVHRKEAVLKKVTSPKIPVHLPAVTGQKIILSRFELKPFLLRIKERYLGRDRFVLIRVYIEFVRKKVPTEMSSKREIVRTLIYRQLLKHFSNGKKNLDQKKHFREELIPALNTFFKGGGVYNVEFKEFSVRE